MPVMKDFKDIDSYIADFPAGTQKMLKQIRITIKKLVPKAEEKIVYGIPTFYLNGNLVHFGGAKNHIGFYPTPSAIVAFKNELKDYVTSKGTVQFPLDKPLPVNLITQMVEFRVMEAEEKAQAKTKAKSKKESKSEYIKYHNDGTIWAKGTMIGDKPDGYWQFFRKDGVIMRSGYFDKGKQTGEWTTYDKKGKVYKVTKIK
jgi:uncharacterized protein YdhG (YjbR/CyaY superfamily)